jgi:hypothetical protein
MTLTPSQYKGYYRKVDVPLANGGSSTVDVHKYRLATAPPTADFRRNEAAMNAFLDKLKGGVKIDLRVNLVPVKDDTPTGVQPVAASVLSGLTVMARYVFGGKGAPEHCQIVLQLADHWGLAPDGLQAYADSALGLDCNGFVGNYLWHARLGKPWNEMGLDKHDGPDQTIDDYFDTRSKKLVSKWEDINSANIYILGEANETTGKIIPGGGSDTGHITITEPGQFRAAMPPFPSGIWVVESTASAPDPGLLESWYSLDTAAGALKVFKLTRESITNARRKVFFKIAQVT